MFNELQLIEYSPATGWIWDNLNQVFFSTLGGVTFFSPLVGMRGDPAVADFNGSTFMFYRDVNNNIQMVAHNFATNTWSHRSVNAVAAVPLAADSPVVYIAGGTMHVIFQTPDTTWQLPAPTDFGPLGLVGGRIIDAFTTDGVNWKKATLTNIPNTTPPGTFGNAEQPIYGTPSVIVNGNSIAVIFINGVNSNIYDINFYGATVSLAVYFDLVLTEIDFTPGGVPTTSGESLWGPFLDGVTF